MIRIIAHALACSSPFGRDGRRAGRAAPPTLKELVDGRPRDVVRIGDLVENAGAAADIAIFRAPDLGQTGAVAGRPRRRGAAAARHRRTRHRGLHRGGGHAAPRVITAKDIEERIARALAGQYGFGDAENLAVTLRPRGAHAPRRAVGDGRPADRAHERRAAHRPLRRHVRASGQRRRAPAAAALHRHRRPRRSRSRR